MAMVSIDKSDYWNIVSDGCNRILFYTMVLEMEAKLLAFLFGLFLWAITIAAILYAIGRWVFVA